MATFGSVSGSTTLKLGRSFCSRVMCCRMRAHSASTRCLASGVVQSVCGSCSAIQDAIDLGSSSLQSWSVLVYADCNATNQQAPQRTLHQPELTSRGTGG